MRIHESESEFQSDAAEGAKGVTPPCGKHGGKWTTVEGGADVGR